MNLFKECNELLDRAPMMLDAIVLALGEKQDLYACQGNLTDGMPDWLTSHFEGIDSLMSKVPNTFPAEWMTYFDAMSETVVALFAKIEKEMPYEEMCAEFEKTDDQDPILYTRGGEMLHRGYFSPEENTLNAKRGTKCRKSSVEKVLYNFKYWLREEKPIRAQKSDRDNTPTSLLYDEFIFALSQKRTLGIVYGNTPSENGFIKMPGHLALCEYDARAEFYDIFSVTVSCTTAAPWNTRNFCARRIPFPPI